MPSLNFKKQFADKIISGDKRQTIRQTRKYPIKPGDRLYLYTGMMHKNCRKLGEAVCTEVVPFEMTWMDGLVIVSGYKGETSQLAHDDGFESTNDFIMFFITTYGINENQSKAFDIIKWEGLI